MASENGPVDPNRLTAEQTAKLLSAAAKVLVLPSHIQKDIDDGAPTSADGTISLVGYAAWLLKEMGRGD